MLLVEPRLYLAHIGIEIGYGGICRSRRPRPARSARHRENQDRANKNQGRCGVELLPHALNIGPTGRVRAMQETAIEIECSSPRNSLQRKRIAEVIPAGDPLCRAGSSGTLNT